MLSLIIILATGILIFLMWGVFRSLPRINRIVTRSFWCPVRERRVTAEFQENLSEGKRIEVNWCTAFSPATAIECGKACLGLDELPAVGEREERPAQVGVVEASRSP